MDMAMLLALATAAVVVTVAIASTVVVMSGRRRLEHELDASRAQLDRLGDQVEELSRQVAESATDTQSAASRESREFVITSLPGRALSTALAPPDPADQPDAEHLSAGQFASVAVGESLVRLISIGYGVRRALTPENRNRIRFAMRQEVRRARRQRRHDLKEARRHLRAQQAGGESAHLTSDAA
jgi:hypothetical protein